LESPLVLLLFDDSIAHNTGCSYEIRQSRTDLLPAARLETAVGIDPDLLRWQDTQDVKNAW
jgi:hypothetical protein